MVKRERLKTTICLYLNYLVHGMAIVILAQNMLALENQWGVDTAGVAYVISSLGIGRLLVLSVSGFLSDHFGRKIFVELGVLTYIPFFIGIICSGNITQAYFFGVLAGMANSFLDSGTYPALMELYPKAQSTANIVIKAFASIGELLLPILVGVLEKNFLWYGWSFVVCTLILIWNFLFLLKRKFPVGTSTKSSSTIAVPRVEAKGKKTQRIFLGIVLTIYGYISMATFYLVSQWMTKYGEDIVHLDLMHARMLVSIYSAGSIIGVIVNAMLVNRMVKQTWLICGYTTISFVILLLMAAYPSAQIMTWGSFIIGFTAAGGVMQIGLTVMSSLFPLHKGVVTGIYYTAGGVASFTIPVITGIISRTNVHNIMWLDVCIAAMGLVCSLIIVAMKKYL